MNDQQDFLLADIARVAVTRPDVDSIPLKDWEKGDILDLIDCYDHEAEVTVFWEGCYLSGVGAYSCGELQEVKDIEIKGRD